ncbi:hypothetical protein AVEN_140531-1 [Araneus ventricosus]|uniref:Uncharacterized protein n=1 Tax=Araneus ventricosus TaxID=182803 RepID=A0A4Y2UUB4_ARAVE|nr:hypothetical protein AVEN_39595-1 [Araneus ventricosus]GBO15704.1 hypothetical protein AVEN_140531-1 [Araneus ventricosus]
MASNHSVIMQGPRRAPYLDTSVYGTIVRVSCMSEEIKNRGYLQKKDKFIGFVGDWGVGKDSLALRILDMDIPDPKVELDHPNVRRRCMREIRDFNTEENFELAIRIIPGKHYYRERDEHFFDNLRPGDYPFDALVFCFALNCSISCYNLENWWLPRAMAAFAYRMPLYLVVGTKSDLPEDAVTQEQLRSLRASTIAMNYYRSSAHNNTGIVEIRKNLIYIFSRE